MRSNRFARLGLLAGSACVAGALLVFSGADGPDLTYGFQKAPVTVRPTVGPLTIKEQLSGYLDPWKSIRLASGSRWTTHIVSLVPEGTWVRKGDVICELDSTAPREFEEARQVRLISARAEVANARVNELLVEARNRRRLNSVRARLDKTKGKRTEYVEAEEPRRRGELTSRARLAADRLDRAEQELDFSRQLFRRGYTPLSDLAQHERAWERAEHNWESAERALEVHDRYGAPRELIEWAGQVEDARAQVEATELRNELIEMQTEIGTLADERRLQIYEKYHKAALESIEACTIRAPCDGQVFHANAWGRRSYGKSRIEEGARVRFNQELIRLPDFSRYKVVAWVHESMYHQIELGQVASVSLKALPDVTLDGQVSWIASFPTARDYYNPGRREFEVSIDLDVDPETLERLAPRLDAEIDLTLARHEEVLQVPADCIIPNHGACHVIVQAKHGFEARPVEIGRTGDDFVEVVAGLQPTDHVVREPGPDMEAIVPADSRG